MVLKSNNIIDQLIQKQEQMWYKSATYAINHFGLKSVYW